MFHSLIHIYNTYNIYDHNIILSANIDNTVKYLGGPKTATYRFLTVPLSSLIVPYRPLSFLTHPKISLLFPCCFLPGLMVS